MNSFSAVAVILGLFLSSPGTAHAEVDLSELLPATARKADFVTDKRNHWAFRPPTRPAVPKVRNSNWPHNPIDNFVLPRLESPPGSRETTAALEKGAKSRRTSQTAL